MRRLTLLILPLLLTGCRAVFIDHRPDGSTRVYAASLLTDPAIGNLAWETPTTKVTLTNYASKSAVTGADLAAIGTVILKGLLIP